MDVSPDLQAPTPDAVREQLGRILAADTFANAGRLSRLLRYVVERAVAGEGAQLKEYALGVDVFDRGDTYDPRLDSIVRVEARRLRARLDDYYRGPGASDPVVITIPRGAYAPVFSPAAPVSSAAGAQADPASPVEAQPTGRPIRSARSLAALGAVGVVLTAFLVGAAVSQRATAPAAEGAADRSVAVLPFEHYSTDPADALIAARLTDSVTTELARLGTLSVVSRTTMSRYADRLRPAREIAGALGVDFIMESTVTIENGHLTVVARLVSAELDRKVWVGEYDAPGGPTRELSRRIAAESSAAALKYAAAH